MKKKSKGIGKSIISAEVPNIVLFVKMAALTNMPIGYEMYEKAITEYPEHFPEEVEHRRKWDLIPQEVHDAYNKEMFGEGGGLFLSNENRDEFEEQIGKCPHTELQGNGIIWRVTVGDEKYYNEMQDIDAWNNKYYKLRSIKEKAIWEKHYSKYGISKD